MQNKKQNVFISLSVNFPNAPIRLLSTRVEKGIETYGEPLMTNNGRDAKQDMIEEMLDMIMYAHQVELENPKSAHGITRFAINSYENAMLLLSKL